MFKESRLDKVLYRIKKLIPKSVFSFFQPAYHWILSYAGAILYGFPSRSMKVIGVTGTKGKSTTVYLITKILEGLGKPVAAVGSLGFVIAGEAGASSEERASRAKLEGDEKRRSPLQVREWPNTLKMTMPGRFKLHKFFSQAKKAGCEYVVLEVTSEGIKQKRHLGIDFDCAVFTNLHKEHIESHGSFEKYLAAKQELFKKTKGIHVINADDKYANSFGGFTAKQKIFYGIVRGDIRADKINTTPTGSSFEVYGTNFDIKFGGQFNVLNALAALATTAMLGVDLPDASPILKRISHIPGRMDFVQVEPFGVVIDYAHTPDSLDAVYRALRPEAKKLICVLGAAGGGRDKWKRPEFGKIAGKYCDEVILTNEDPYEEDPNQILSEIKSGISNSHVATPKILEIIDRKEAIKTALTDAKKGDIVVITGKGSEVSMAIAGGKKIPWSDRDIALELLK